MMDLCISGVFISCIINVEELQLRVFVYFFCSLVGGRSHTVIIFLFSRYFWQSRPNVFSDDVIMR